MCHEDVDIRFQGDTYSYIVGDQDIKKYCIRDIACLYRTLRILKIKAIIRWGEGREKVLYVRMTYNNVPTSEVEKEKGKFLFLFHFVQAVFFCVRFGLIVFMRGRHDSLNSLLIPF